MGGAASGGADCGAGGAVGAAGAAVGEGTAVNRPPLQPHHAAIRPQRRTVALQKPASGRVPAALRRRLDDLRRRATHPLADETHP